jgi:hypothetical protein
VDEAVEDGVGVGWIADHRVPVLDGELAGDDGGAAAVVRDGVWRLFSAAPEGRFASRSKIAAVRHPVIRRAILTP